VYGADRRVYRFDGQDLPAELNAGLRLATTGLVTPNSYSVEMIFEFTEDPGFYRRILDVRGGEADAGFYVDPFMRLRVYPETQSGVTDFQTNRFYHVVLTNAAGQVRVYLDGFLEFEIPNTDVMNIANPGNLLTLFADDKAISGEYADGRIALLRVYNGVLNDIDVILLGAYPFLFP
jgi:concanavalin A-like lectin/glucanase superfamily protein